MPRDKTFNSSTLNNKSTHTYELNKAAWDKIFKLSRILINPD